MNDTLPKPYNNFLEQIRLAELRKIEAVLEKHSEQGARILEIGAGTGWQARELSDRGFDVEAIDIPNSNHNMSRIWPIINFDGHNIPYSNSSFDIVYSSNVLEHVTNQEALNEEIQRVLRDDGIAVHYVPTTAWRAWSLLAFYPALVKDAVKRFLRNLIATTTEENENISLSGEKPLMEKLLRRIVPHAHGAHGTFLNELSLFSKSGWDDFFKQFNWVTIEYGVNGLFLTGDMLFGSKLSVGLRQSLSHVLGSTAHFYVLNKATPQILDHEKAPTTNEPDAVLNINYSAWLPDSVDARILDLGCGTGRMLQFLSSHGYKNITGIDRDEHSLNQIPELLGVITEYVEAGSKYFDEHQNEYDLIILKQMLYYIPFDEMIDFIEALRRSLRPDGIVIVEFFNATLLSSRFTELKDPFIRTAFTEHSIRRLLESGGMEVIEVYGERRMPPTRFRSRVYTLLRKAWILVLKGIYIIERGMDSEFPKIYTKSILAIAKRK